MALHCPARESEPHQPVRLIDRIVVLSLGGVAAGLAVVFAAAGDWMYAGSLAGTALVLGAVAWRGRKPAMERTKGVASVMTDLAGMG